MKGIGSSGSANGKYIFELGVTDALDAPDDKLLFHTSLYYSSKVTWDQWLPYAMFSFNTLVHESTGITPHEAVFGRKVRYPSEFAEENIPLTYIGMVDELLKKS